MAGVLCARGERPRWGGEGGTRLGAGQARGAGPGWKGGAGLRGGARVEGRGRPEGRGLHCCLVLMGDKQNDVHFVGASVGLTAPFSLLPSSPLSDLKTNVVN